MMKKLLSILMIGTCAVFMAQTADAQVCTPDNSHAGNPGIYPDSATGLDVALVGQVYSQTITVVLPTDTSATIPGVGPVDLTMDSIGIDSVRLVMAPGDTTGLLSDIGFAYACEPPSCAFPGGQSGCLVLTAAGPLLADVGTYHMYVYVTAYVTHALIGPLSAPNQIDDYYIVIEEDNAVESLNASKFELGQSIPNPSNGNMTINFTNPTSSTVDFKVFNILGEVVHTEKINSVAGLNKIKYNAELAQGVYVYTLTNGNTTLSKRMVVAGK